MLEHLNLHTTGDTAAQKGAKRVERRESMVRPFTPDESVAFMVAQGILGGRYVNQGMPAAVVARYRELASLPETDEVRQEQAHLKETLVAERNRLGMEWMLNKTGQRFSKLIGNLIEIASGTSTEKPTSEQVEDALRFTRDLMELGRAPNAQETDDGYLLSLTPEQEALAARLQAELNRREKAEEKLSQ